MIEVFEDVQVGKYQRPTVKTVSEKRGDNEEILFKDGIPVIRGWYFLQCLIFEYEKL